MKRILPFIVFTFFVRTLFAQLSGEYTINPDLPYAGTNFQTFDVAFMVLNSSGTSGPVVFKVAAGKIFNENPRVLTASGSVTNPIVFIKDGTGANPVIRPTGTGAANDAGISVLKASYLTFDGIDVWINSDDLAVEYGYNFSSGDNVGCTHNQIKNCRVIVSYSNTNAVGVRFLDFGVTSAEGANSYNYIMGVTVQDSYAGFKFEGTSGFKGESNTITNSWAVNIGYLSSTSPVRAVSIQYQNNFALNYTNVVGVSGSNATSSYGTNAFYLVDNSNVSMLGCGIHNIEGEYAYGINYSNIENLSISNCPIYGISANLNAYGIHCSSGTANIVSISNNTIYDIVSDGTGANKAAGIFIGSGSELLIEKNTVHTITASNGNGATVTGINASSSTVLSIEKNNIYGLSSDVSAGIVNVTGIYTAGDALKTIINNTIADISAPATASFASACGIKLAGNNNVGVWHNSVLINDGPTLDSKSFALYTSVNATKLVELKNNIFINNSDVSTAGKAIVIGKAATSLFSPTSNNNIYYAGTPGPSNLIFYNNAGTPTETQTLAEYQTAVSPAESASLTENIAFVSSVEPFDLHINAAECTAANNSGIPISEVIEDFDGDARNESNPDIGADEFSFPTYSAGDDDQVCGNIYTFSAEAAPTGGSGEWSTDLVGMLFDNSASENAQVTVPAYGLQTFTWTVTKQSCTSTDDISVTFFELPEANAGADDFACGLTYGLIGNSLNVGETGQWTTSSTGAVFENDQLPETDVTMDTYGEHIFTWTVDDGTCSASDEVTISFFEQPEADFSFVCNGFETNFTNLSTSATAYEWNFGDGTPVSSEENPVHTYTENGTFTVLLTANNAGCSDTYSSDITFAVGVESVLNNSIKLFPNPVEDELSILGIDNSDNVRIEICDVSGKTVKIWDIRSEEKKINVSDLKSGIYFVKIISKNGNISKKLSKI